MQAQVDFTEGTLTKHLADLVQLELRLGRFLVLAEAVEDELADQVDFFGARRQIFRLAFISFDVVEDVVVTHSLVACFLCRRPVLLLSRLLIFNRRRVRLLLQSPHIVVRLVLVKALRSGELAELTQLVLGVGHDRKPGLKRTTHSLIMQLLLLLLVL